MPLGSMMSLSGLAARMSCAMAAPSGPDNAQHRQPPASSRITKPPVVLLLLGASAGDEAPAVTMPSEVLLQAR